MTVEVAKTYPKWDSVEKEFRKRFNDPAKIKPRGKWSPGAEPQDIDRAKKLFPKHLESVRQAHAKGEADFKAGKYKGHSEGKIVRKVIGTGTRSFMRQKGTTKGVVTNPMIRLHPKNWDGTSYASIVFNEDADKELAMAKKKKRAGPPKSAAAKKKVTSGLTSFRVHQRKMLAALHSQIDKAFPELTSSASARDFGEFIVKIEGVGFKDDFYKRMRDLGRELYDALDIGAHGVPDKISSAEEASMKDRSEEVAKKLSPKLKLLIDKNGHNIAKKLYQEYIGDEDWGNYAHFMWRLDQLLLKMGGKPEGGEEEEKEEKGGDEPGGMDEVEPADYLNKGDAGEDDATEASVADKALARLEDYHRQEESAKKKLPSRVGTNVKHKTHGKGVITKQHPKKGYLVTWANKKTPASWHHGFHLSSGKKKAAKKAAKKTIGKPSPFDRKAHADQMVLGPKAVSKGMSRTLKGMKKKKSKK